MAYHSIISYHFDRKKPLASMFPKVLPLCKMYIYIHIIYLPRPKMICCVTATYGGGHCSSSGDYFSPRKSSIRTKRLALVGSGIFATHGSPQNHILYLVLDFQGHT